LTALAQHAPLSNIPVFGKTLLEYWLEHLAVKGARHVRIYTADRPDKVRELVNDGARWGITTEVVKESRELSPSLARKIYAPCEGPDWLPDHNMVLMDHFPGLPQFPILNSYSTWFAALEAWLPSAATLNRIGVREILPGVWASGRARIHPSSQLVGPCWIGEHAQIGARCVLGPMAVIEDRSWIESDSEISNSLISADTFVGKLTRMSDSLASGNTLVNWMTGSVVEVNDPFILSTLKHSPSRPKAFSWLRKLTGDYTVDKEELELSWEPPGMKLP
jgi:NDP-sugar pyrophosphorylase family protein